MKNLINEELSNRIISFFNKYLDFYKSFLKIESSKFNNLTNGNLKTIDESVKEEEAYMLKAKGLEVERDKLLAEAANPKATFSQLIDILSPAYSTEAKKIYEELSQVLLDLKEMNTRCNCLTELKLNRANREIDKIQNNPELKKTFDSKVNKLYDSTAKNKNISTNGLFSKKI